MSSAPSTSCSPMQSSLCSETQQAEQNGHEQTDDHQPKQEVVTDGKGGTIVDILYACPEFIIVGFGHTQAHIPTPDGTLDGTLACRLATRVAATRYEPLQLLSRIGGRSLNGTHRLARVAPFQRTPTTTHRNDKLFELHNLAFVIRQFTSEKRAADRLGDSGRERWGRRRSIGWWRRQMRQRWG